MTNYRPWMDEACEPANPRVYGRVHKLLEETVYPIDEERVEWNCFLKERRDRQIRSMNDNGYMDDNYHWWLYFQSFHPFSHLDMGR